MKKVTIIAFILVIIGFIAYIIGSIAVSNSLSNGITLISKPGENNNLNIVSPADTSGNNMGINTTPTASIAAPVVDNKGDIMSSNPSIINPNTNQLSNILSTQSPAGYTINTLQAIGNLNIQPYKLKVYSKPSLKAKYGYLDTNDRYITVTGYIGNWYRVSISNYIGFIEKSTVDLSAIINSGSEFIKCNLIGSVEGINKPNVLLNVRQAPNENSKILYRLSNFGDFNIIGAIGAWYKVNIQGEIGYVNTKYVGTILPSIIGNSFRVMDNVVSFEGGDSDEDYVISDQPVSLYVTTNSQVPVYSNNSDKSKVLFYLSNDEEFKAIKSGANWVEINSGNRYGYIFPNTIKNL